MRKLKLEIKSKFLSKEFWKKLPRLAAEYPFVSFLILVALAFFLGGILFYQYGFLAKKAEPEILEELLQFNEKNYQEVLEAWAEHQKIFERAEFKEYPDLFRSSAPAPEED